MIDYIELATRCWDDVEGASSCADLLGLSPEARAEFDEKHFAACLADYEAAIEGAFRTGQLDVAGTQVEMFQRAA